ncbi:MAG: Hsp20/alpha crystallin family protein [Promethearchaeota archaeon]|nr:MAG: Hsp20/alpha crystallin family protein [Candidatus Lokiarchaeota archaeon]
MTEQKQIEKLYLSPDICMWPDDEYENYHIEITLPGVEKDTIKLKMHEDSFFIKGETEDTVYIGSYTVCYEIDPTKANAQYKNGLLKIDVPLKQPEFKSIDVQIR